MTVLQGNYLMYLPYQFWFGTKHEYFRQSRSVTNVSTKITYFKIKQTRNPRNRLGIVPSRSLQLQALGPIVLY